MHTPRWVTAKRWSVKDLRRCWVFENVHNAWLMSNGAGHTGRRVASRNKPAAGWGDNQRTSANTTEPPWNMRDLGKTIPVLPKPEILTNIWIWYDGHIWNEWARIWGKNKLHVYVYQKHVYVIRSTYMWYSPAQRRLYHFQSPVIVQSPYDPEIWSSFQHSVENDHPYMCNMHRRIPTAVPWGVEHYLLVLVPFLT